MSVASLARRLAASVLLSAPLVLAGPAAHAQTATTTSTAPATTAATSTTLPPVTATPTAGIPAGTSNQQKKPPSTKILAGVAGAAILVALVLFWLDYRGRSGG
jgi:hypothetical protein